MNKNENLDKWRNDSYKRIREGQPKIVVQSEVGKKIRERWDKWRQNPAKDSREHQNFSAN
jgi:hypothetical protein